MNIGHSKLYNELQDRIESKRFIHQSITALIVIGAIAWIFVIINL